MMKVVREVFNSHEKIYEAPDTGRKKQEGEERKKGKEGEERERGGERWRGERERARERGN